MLLIVNLLNEGGAFFMYPLLFILILVIILIAKAFVKKDSKEKTISLLKSITLFALVWGFLGHIIGMIGAFDSIESSNEITSATFAAGLKISLLTPVFGSVVFLVGRLGIIILTWITPAKK